MASSAVSPPPAAFALARTYLVHVLAWAALGAVLSLFGADTPVAELTAAGAAFGLLFATGAATLGRDRFVRILLHAGLAFVPALAAGFVAWIAAMALLLLPWWILHATGLVPWDLEAVGGVFRIVGGVVAWGTFLVDLVRRHRRLRERLWHDARDQPDVHRSSSTMSTPRPSP